MNGRRVIVGAVVVGLLVGMVSWWGGRTTSTAVDVARPEIPVAGAPADLSSTWFCAASALAPGRAARHVVIMSNPTSRPATVRLSGYTLKGPSGSKAATVEANATTEIVVDDFFAPGTSVMVESPVAPVVVAHRLQNAQFADQVACVTSSSDRWYFGSQSTVLGTAATLVLFNPFSVDAGADVRISLAAGVRSPRALSGIVVPAGQVRYVNLGDSVQRRDEFSATVRLRSGRLIAETIQTFDGTKGPRGMRIQSGVSSAETRWDLPGGFTGANATERITVFNPTRRTANALVQVTPYGAAEVPPEPFELEVPALRFVVLNLSEESRVPGVGYHSISVEADAPVVAARTITISGPPGAPTAGAATRPPVERGSAIGTGSPLQSTKWLAPAVRTGADQRSVVVIHNASAGIALVKVSILRGGKQVVLPGYERLELAPGDGVVVAIGPKDLPDGSVGVLVSGSTPIVVESLSTFEASDDFATDLAVPIPTRSFGPEPLAAN